MKYVQMCCKDGTCAGLWMVTTAARAADANFQTSGSAEKVRSNFIRRRLFVKCEDMGLYKHFHRQQSSVERGPASSMFESTRSISIHDTLKCSSCEECMLGRHGREGAPDSDHLQGLKGQSSLKEPHTSRRTLSSGKSSRSLDSQILNARSWAFIARMFHKEIVEFIRMLWCTTMVIRKILPRLRSSNGVYTVDDDEKNDLGSTLLAWSKRTGSLYTHLWGIPVSQPRARTVANEGERYASKEWRRFLFK